MARTGVRLLWGTANLFSHPALRRPARPPTPTPRSSPTRRRRSSTCSRSRSAWAARTTSCGAAARATRRCSTPTSGARSDSWRASWHLVAEHKHEHRLQGHAAHRAQAAGADEAPVRLRHARPSTASSSATAWRTEYRVNIEANHATLAGHSFQHEVAYAVANGIFGSIDANRGDPQNGWDTDQFPNSVDELALAMLRDPARRRLHDRRLQLRRQAAPPEHGPRPTCSTGTSAASTRWRARCSWPPR